jgi:prolyl-tRNA editing enzyme YbaK/EbsC (Cys-tRNA(Pro) deacylase)
MDDAHHNQASDENPEVIRNITAAISAAGFQYELLEHEFVHSSEDAAKTRGTNLKEAAKALVFQAKWKDGRGAELLMCVVSGHRKIDMKKVKKLHGCKNLTLADPEDVRRATGCKVGTVSPFPGLFGMKGYSDKGVVDNADVVFSIASHHKSVRMRAVDWQVVSGASIEDLAKEEEEKATEADATEAGAR